MIKRIRPHSRPLGLGFGLLLGLGSLAMGAAVPAFADSPAPNNCNASKGTVQVQLVGINSGSSIVLAQTQKGDFEGQVSIRVFCKANVSGGDTGYIPNAKLRVTALGDGVTFAINGVTGSSLDVGPFDGSTVITISSPTPDLALTVDPVAVGSYREDVVQAFGQPITVGTAYAGGSLYAETPELDSIVLFGSGALGLAGYGLTRLRAGRRRTA